MVTSPAVSQGGTPAVSQGGTPAVSREPTPARMTLDECWEAMCKDRAATPQVATPSMVPLPDMIHGDGYRRMTRYAPRPVPTRCWLCEFAGDPDERILSKYVQDNVALVGTDQMASALYTELQRIAPGSAGTCTSEIRAHITTHMLNPTVRVASILRTLLDLVDKLSGIVTSTTEDGVVVLDSKNINVYLNVVNEVMKLYKTGEASRLMFGDLEKKSAASSSGVNNTNNA